LEAFGVDCSVTWAYVPELTEEVRHLYFLAFVVGGVEGNRFVLVLSASVATFFDKSLNDKILSTYFDYVGAYL
jgi:hypothetical protein